MHPLYLHLTFELNIFLKFRVEKQSEEAWNLFFFSPQIVSQTDKIISYQEQSLKILNQDSL